MKTLNRILTVFAIVVLIVTTAILFWLRRRVTGALDEAIETTQQLIDAEEILKEPSFNRADFSAAEARVRDAKINHFIRDVVVTKRLEGAPEALREAPIVPYDLLALYGPQWRETILEGLRKIPIVGPDGRTYGYLYFDLDLATIRSVNLAMAATALALMTIGLILIRRIYAQETSLVRVGGEMEQRRKELIRIERLALAGQLSAGLLHDLKKPVLHIRHSMEDLEEALGDFAGATAAISDTRRQIDLFFALLEDCGIERFVRSDRVQEEYVDINEILQTALRLVQYERRSVQIQTQLAESLPPVLAQPYRLIQLFSNLILNAYQAMGGQGALRLETAKLGTGVQVRISDDGPGIPPSLIDSVFDPFVTSKPEAEGSGLGLAICRMIVDDLHGTIEVQSPPGEGAIFELWLPANAPTLD